MTVYFLLLLALSLSIAVVRQYFKNTPLTYPTVSSYLQFNKQLIDSNRQTSLDHTEQAQEELQQQFMQFIVNLGNKSLCSGHKGVAYFRLMNGIPVYVISKAALIKQIYERRNEGNFSQTSLFDGLAVILGDSNLMSSGLHSSIHRNIRCDILERNETYRDKLGIIIDEYFEMLSVNPSRKTLSDVMDALSRRVLLFTYLSKNSIEPFEKLYQQERAISQHLGKPELSRELMGSLFSMNKITEKDKLRLLSIRQRIFNFALRLLDAQALRQELLAEDSWINRLMKERVIRNEALSSDLKKMDINPETHSLSQNNCQRLIDYAQAHDDKDALAAAVRNVVNESLFIPLLGFDATATLLVTTWRIIMQDSRIYKLVKKEIYERIADEKELKFNGFEFHAFWNFHDATHFSYTEAVILEALRLMPPAPVIPEIATKSFTLDAEGELLNIPEGAMIFIPLETIHKDASNFPQLDLSEAGKKILDKEKITARDIFPERWGPRDSEGQFYNTHLLKFPLRVMDRQLAALFSFKSGSRQCPGLRIALTETLYSLRKLMDYRFNLEKENDLRLEFNYQKPLQRAGGNGYFTVRKLAPAKEAAGEQQGDYSPVLRFINFEQGAEEEKEQVLKCL